VTSTTSDSDELDLVDEEEDDESLAQRVSGQFGQIVGKLGGVSSTTVSSLQDGETIVGVVKKERLVGGGRKKAKVVVVSRLSDFNPILVGKLGAECSCKSQSKTISLRRGPGRKGLFKPQSGSTTEQTVVEIKPVNRIYSTTSAPALPTLPQGDYDEYAEQQTGERIYSTTAGPVRSGVRGSSRKLYTTTGAPERAAPGVPGASFDRYGPGGLRGADETLQGSVDCQRAGLFRHPKYCNKFYACNWDAWKKRFTLHVFNCPIHLAYDSNLGACNWPSKGPACADDNLLV
jgi:hypothetical protein